MFIFAQETGRGGVLGLHIGTDEQQAELGKKGGNNGENGEKCKHRISLAVAGGMFAVPV